MNARWWERSWARAAGAGALASLLSLPLLAYGFTFDQSVFAVMADAMLNGDVLYRDAWEHKPPGVYCAYAFAFLLFGRDIVSVRVLEILFVGLSAAGLTRMMEYRFGGRLAAFAAAVFLPFPYLLLIGNSAQPEGFQIAFVVWSLALWPKRGDARRGVGYVLASALLMSLAVLFKTPIATLAFAMVVDRFLMDCGRERWKERLAPGLIALAGLAFPPLATAGYYAARGAFEPLFDAWVSFPSSYARWSSGRPLSAHAAQWLSWVPLQLTWPGLLLIAVGIAKGWKASRAETVWWVSMAFAAFACTAIQSRNFQYYYFVMVPFIAGSLGLGLLPSDGESRAASALRGVGIALAGVALALYVRWVWPVWRDFKTVARLPAPSASLPTAEGGSIGIPEVARAVRALTRPEDRIFVWGDRPEVYFWADRRPGGGFFHLLQILPKWGTRERFLRFVERLQRERTRLIVIYPGPSWHVGPDALVLLEEKPEMKALLASDYRLAASASGHQFWVLNE